VTDADGAALVVIDMQRVFADPASAWATPRYADAAAGVARLLPAFAGRTVFTRFVAPEHPSGAWLPYYDLWPDQLQPPDAAIWDLTPGFGEAGEPVVSAATFGKWGADLAEAARHTERLVLCGVSTDCCVLSTALAAADAGIFVTVVADACAGASEEDHQRALAAMALYAPLIRLTTVDEVLGSVTLSA
jgi:nicotinamidase-related amidase